MARKKKVITVKGSTKKKQAQKKKGMTQQQSLTVNVITGRRKASGKISVRPAKPPIVFSPVINLGKAENTPALPAPPTTDANRVSFQIPQTVATPDMVRLNRVFQSEEPEFFNFNFSRQPLKEIQTIPTTNSISIRLPTEKENDLISISQTVEDETINPPTKTRDMKIRFETPQESTYKSIAYPAPSRVFDSVPQLADSVASAPQIQREQKVSKGKGAKTPDVKKTKEIADELSPIIRFEPVGEPPVSKPFNEGETVRKPRTSKEELARMFESPNILDQPYYVSFDTSIPDRVDYLYDTRPYIYEPLQPSQTQKKTPVFNTPPLTVKRPIQPFPSPPFEEVEDEKTRTPYNPPEPEYISSQTPDMFSPSIISNEEVELSDFAIETNPEGLIKRKSGSRQLIMPVEPVSVVEPPYTEARLPKFEGSSRVGIPPSSRASKAPLKIMPIEGLESETVPSLPVSIPPKSVLVNDKRPKPLIAELKMPKMPPSMPTIPLLNIDEDVVVAGDLNIKRGRGRPIKVVENPSLEDMRRLVRAQKERERYQRRVNERNRKADNLNNPPFEDEGL